MTSEARAAADLAALLPADHVLARLGRLRLDAAVRRQNQEQIMDITEYDHNHDLSGAFISHTTTQDALEVPCAECGQRTNGHAHCHDKQCAHYAPHSSSVAAVKMDQARRAAYGSALAETATGGR